MIGDAATWADDAIALQDRVGIAAHGGEYARLQLQLAGAPYEAATDESAIQMLAAVRIQQRAKAAGEGDVTLLEALHRVESAARGR